MEKQVTVKSDSRKKYQHEWDSRNTKNIGVKLNYRTDADILSRLATVNNVQGYVKQLIRDDIARHSREESEE